MRCPKMQIAGLFAPGAVTVACLQASCVSAHGLVARLDEVGVVVLETDGTMAVVTADRSGLASALAPVSGVREQTGATRLHR